MKESDNICKISLMIAYKKNVLFWEFANMFRAGDLKFVNNGKSRIGNSSDNGIYQRTEWFDVVESLKKSRHVAMNSDTN